MVRICLVCKKPPNWLPKSLYHFAFPLTVNASSYCFISSSAFLVVSVPDFGHSNSYVFFPWEHVMRNIFLCASVLSVYLWWGVCYGLWPISPHLILCVKNALYSLDNIPLLEVSFVGHTFYSEWCGNIFSSLLLCTSYLSIPKVPSLIQVIVSDLELQRSPLLIFPLNASIKTPAWVYCFRVLNHSMSPCGSK